tara:strand:- start:2788 stop:3111 length:324 start_codon:yes stop_codon:yes gene_type:complete
VDKERFLKQIEEYMMEQRDKLENAKEEIQEAVVELDLKKKLYLENPKKGVLDAVQEKMVSRKLLVFISATALLASAQLDPDTWGMIAMMYIGGQTAVDFAKMWRHGS